jgi:TRAP-type C4-dicarboxylate transport system substrate-binding protein
MRSSGSVVVNETIRAMGAEPTPLAWSEVYPGLQQKVIDAAEAQYPAVYGAHLYEVITTVTKTSHFQLITGLATGSKWFNTLPKNYQKMLLEEALKAGDYASHLTIDSLNDYEAKMKKEGVQINNIDTTPFKKATEAVYDKIKGYQELRQQVNKALKK